MKYEVKTIRKILNKIKNKINNKKGSGLLEFAICLLIFILVFGFIFDLFLISVKQHYITKETNRLVRVIGQQGGIEKVPPAGSANNREYYNANEFYNDLNSYMLDRGIVSWDGEIKVQDRTSKVESIYQLGADDIGIKANYRDKITLKVNYKYKWGIWSNFIPGEQIGERTVERVSFCELKRNFDDWRSEDENITN